MEFSCYIPLRVSTLEPTRCLVEGSQARLLTRRFPTEAAGFWTVDGGDGSLSSAIFVAGSAERGLASSLLLHIASQTTLLQQKEGSMGSIGSFVIMRDPATSKKSVMKAALLRAEELLGNLTHAKLKALAQACSSGS